jgi:hypothetical protein
MGLFNLFSKKTPRPTKPYSEEAMNKIYDSLFCDNIDLFKSDTKPDIYPWDTLLADTPDVEKLKAISIDKSLEARHRILAFNLLRMKGFPTTQKELLGVIVEVSLEGGLDVLAAFSEGCARYINHSEKLLVWEKQTEQSTQLIEKLFNDSLSVVNQIGPWDKERRKFPTKGMVRLTFLVSDGLYFGEGAFLQDDAMAGPVISSATQLMTYLTQQVPRTESNDS